MRLISVQSGSAGNCVYVESGAVSLLIDAGVTGRVLRDRLAVLGVDPAQASALLITHDHADHSRGMGVVNRKFGLPVYISKKTLEASLRWQNCGPMQDVRFFVPGERFSLGHVTIETYPTPHDSTEGSVFVIDDGQKRLGVMTDLGHVFPALRDVMPTLDAVMLESNYDPVMLEKGSYPPFLKRRITGPGGHISNAEAAQLLHHGSQGRLRWACLAHLSEHNNHPDVALRTHREVLGDRVQLTVAQRYCATAAFDF